MDAFQALGGITAGEREALKQCYKLMYRAPLNTTQALERIEQEVTRCAPVEYLIEFLRRIPEGRSGRQDQGSSGRRDYGMYHERRRRIDTDHE